MHGLVLWSERRRSQLAPQGEGRVRGAASVTANWPTHDPFAGSLHGGKPWGDSRTSWDRRVGFFPADSWKHRTSEGEMAVVVDARGKACPQPVILARKALAEASEVTVIVDNETARENVAGMARSQGYAVQVEQKPDGIYLQINRQGAPAPAAATAAEVSCAPAGGPLVVLAGADNVGRGPEELGGILMRAWMHTLTEVAPRPDVLIFLNTGVRLVAEGSPVLDDLRALAAQGVRILACGTCLGYFSLKEKVAVGTVSNMYTIAETLLGAGKVVSI
jgi:selenium metabolism protein YedF